MNRAYWKHRERAETPQQKHSLLQEIVSNKQLEFEYLADERITTIYPPLEFQSKLPRTSLQKPPKTQSQCGFTIRIQIYHFSDFTLKYSEYSEKGALSPFWIFGQYGCRYVQLYVKIAGKARLKHVMKTTYPTNTINEKQEQRLAFPTLL